MTVEPIFDQTTEGIWEELPEFYRIYDENTDWTFKKYLVAHTSQIDVMRTFIERFYYETPDDGGTGYVPGPDGNCDLVNPAKADASWLPWIAQGLGVSLQGIKTEASRRAFLSQPAIGLRSGSNETLKYVIDAVLSESQDVWIADHTTDTSDFGAGSEWDVCFVFFSPDAAADPSIIIDAVEATGQKPAGVKLWVRAYAPTWAIIQSTYPTWADLNDLSWHQIQITL